MKPVVQAFEDNPLVHPSAVGLCVPVLVRQRALSTPHATALSSGNDLVSYGQLDGRANRLARHLRCLGVGADQLVGIHMERSTASVVAQLATLKAGGAFLPLDPSLPAERLAYMAADAKVAAVVTSAPLSGDVPKGAWPVVIFENFDGEELEGPAIDVHPQHLAYVIYTSGSTGKPKGVEITHANLMNLVEWHIEAFQVSPSERASMQAAVGFDAAVWELWPYLVAGASIAIPDEAIRNHPEALRNWLVANKITITFLPTAMTEQMLQLEWPADASLRLLLTGADALRRRPRPRLPFQLINNYGPTECTVVATSGVVLPAESATHPPSIGRAIRNTEIKILDQAMHPVRGGEIGEIYIGGEGVARGYRNNPELTAERFLLNGNGTFLYRTGDLGRFLPEGDVEFLGRTDEQIKIRGFRVEPGEIVNAINAHPGVHASAVTLLGKELGDRKLVAYVVLEAGSALTREALHQALAQRLPEYMLPSVFVRIDSLPLTVNGKVHYASLPAPAAANLLRETESVAPRTLVEQRMAKILSPLLNVEHVSVKDNFFLLGGHSLLGTQLLTKIREVFGVELSLLSLFDHPTLEEMSVEVENLIVAKVVGNNGANGSGAKQSVPERGQ